MVNVGTTPVQLDDGSNPRIYVGNTGQVRATLTTSHGPEVFDPGFFRHIETGGVAVTAKTALGSTTLTVTTTNAAPIPGVDDAELQAAIETALEGIASDVAADPALAEHYLGPELGWLNVVSFGADPTGVADSGPAIRQAVAAVPGTGAVVWFPPGVYRVTATAATTFITLNPKTHLMGVPGASIINLVSDDSAGYREFARNYGDDVTIEGLTVRRGSDFPCVFINSRAFARLTLRKVRLDGKRSTYTSGYCHGLQYGQQSGTYDGILVDDCVFVDLSNCTLMTNASTGTVKRFTLRDSRLNNVDFNAPNGTVSDVLVSGCYIDGVDVGTIGIGVAHVTRGSIVDNTITNVAGEAIHIEDYTTDLKIARNRLVGNDAGIQIISGSSRLTLDDNTIDATANTGSPFQIISVQAGGEGDTPGGRPGAWPSDITVSRNRILGGNNGASNGLYFEKVVNGQIVDNVFTGPGSVTGATYTGPECYALDLFECVAVAVRGNIVTGWKYGSKPYVGANRCFAAGGAIIGNTFTECELGLVLLNTRQVTVTGNAFMDCVLPLITGSGSSTGSAPITVIGNHAHGCAKPMLTGDTFTVTATGTATVGAGRTLTVTAIDRYLPSGTVLSFTGGGTLTLTSAAAARATSLSGTVATAGISAAATATPTTAYSPVGGDNMRLVSENADSTANAAGYARADLPVALAADAIAYDSEGRVSVVTVAGVTTSYTYNGDGSVNTETRFAKIKTYNYDEAGRVSGSVVA